MPSNWAMEDGDSWDLPNTSRDLDTQEQRQEEEDDRIESRVTTATMPKKNKSKKRRKDLAQACYSFSLLLLISTAVGMLFWSILKQGEYGNSLKPPGSVDGGWGRWKGWGVCSRTCGGGEMIRKRDCDHPTPQLGGHWCTGGQDFQVRPCNEFSCGKGSGGKGKKSRGKLGQWTKWSTCSKSCDYGDQKRKRHCYKFGNPEESCAGDLSEERSCNEEPCPVNGAWSSWSSWSGCTQTCNGGIRNRNRDCTRPSPLFGGLDCNGEKTEVHICGKLIC